MPLPWVEALVAVNEDVVAGERRFHDQCIWVAHMAARGQVTVEDEMLLASYVTSLTLLRKRRNNVLAEAPTGE